MVSGGGTGGHIYPALALMRYIETQRDHVEFLYVGTPNGLESKIVENAGYAFQTLQVQGLKRSFSIENVKTAYYLATSIFKAKSIIRSFKPDVVIGTGGYVCAPVLYAAAKLGIPTIIHEQNSVAGITNKWLARYVDVIATCTADVEEDFKKYRHKVVLTGNPRGQEVVHVKSDSAQLVDMGMDDTLPMVVVFGGSRGAPSINQAFVEAYASFEGRPYQVWMITGEAHYESVKNQLTNTILNVQLFPYIKDMPAVFQHCQAVVCRSGATTLTEITALGLPSVLIPSPYVTNNHQQHNAETLTKNHAARMILQKDLTGEVLFQTIDELMSDENIRIAMATQAKTLGITDASVRLWKIIQELVHQ